MKDLLFCDDVQNYGSNLLRNHKNLPIERQFRLNSKFGIFTLAFAKLHQKDVLKCAPHVQHDYVFSFNQSYHCLRALCLLKFLSYK